MQFPGRLPATGSLWMLLMATLLQAPQTSFPFYLSFSCLESPSEPESIPDSKLAKFAESTRWRSESHLRELPPPDMLDAYNLRPPPRSDHRTSEQDPLRQDPLELAFGNPLSRCGCPCVSSAYPN